MTVTVRVGRTTRLLIALAFVSCSDSSPLRWAALEEGQATRGSLAVEASPIRTSTGREWSVSRDGDEIWLEAEIRREEWEARPNMDAWRLATEVRGFGRPGQGDAARLVGPEGAYAMWNGESFRDVGANTFAVGVDATLLRLEEGTEPPESLRFSLYVGRGELAGGRRRVEGRRFTGDGLSVWPGERLELEVQVEGSAALRFTTTHEPFLEPLDETEPSERQEVTFRVAVDGVEAFSHRALAHRDDVAFHSLELPGSGRRSVHLAFEVEGPFAFTNFLDPVIGPAEVGEYGRRPWSGSRPDIVLFVADTFRADNMDTYGGGHGITPRLDELASRSLVFSRAWATSTFTLPSHASMFTGLYARRCGITTGLSVLDEDVPTLAELLADAGYRVGGVTDKGYLSPTFGLDRGFPFFDVDRETMVETRQRARAFLEADDGRPVFLFVHTFRVHGPYVVSDETRAKLGERLGIRGTYEDLVRRRKQLTRKRRTEEWARVMEEHRAHYLGGVADFDGEFAGIIDDLEELGLFENGVLAFTSDHGEAFNENGENFHAGNVWESQVRIPLFLHGVGLEPGRNDHPASLIDLTPTFAALAGITPDSGWDGRSLLENDDERPLYVFRSYGAPDRSSFGVVDGSRKILGIESVEAVREGRLMGAYDLAVDPHEENDLLGGDATWPTDLLRAHAQRLEILLAPVSQAEAHLDAEAMADLSQLGYVGDDEE